MLLLKPEKNIPSINQAFSKNLLDNVLSYITKKNTAETILINESLDLPSLIKNILTRIYNLPLSELNNFNTVLGDFSNKYPQYK